MVNSINQVLLLFTKKIYQLNRQFQLMYLIKLHVWFEYDSVHASESQVTLTIIGKLLRTYFSHDILEIDIFYL